MEIIVGTAGHIDHGKTALIKAMTGVDADRLPEEKQRGITIDLGFAEMSIGDTHFGFVDVPGHERFVKNMLAGASGIDIVMLVIAADEGVMPQTREHFDICRLLGVKSGIVVLTKSDLVDEETLELAKLDAAELIEGSFLEHAPAITVSTRSGSGIDELRETLVSISRERPPRINEMITRLPIDRSFSVKGFGAVVTGTLASGTINEGEDLELLPSKTKVRIRGIQTHGRSVKTASAGQRVAVNLGGIDHSKVERGMLLVEPGILQPTQIFDAEIEVLADAAKPVRSRQRVRVHVGTVEALARIQVLNESGEVTAGDKNLAQIRLETPIAVVPNERFIIRRYSPQMTIAGGTVIDNAAAKHRRKDISKVLEYLNAQLNAANSTEKIRLIINAASTAGSSSADLRARTGLKQALLEAAKQELIAGGEIIDASGRFIERAAFDTLKNSTTNAIADFHKTDPLAKGSSREALREKLFSYLPGEIFQAILTELESQNEIVLDRESVRLRSYQTTLSPEETELKDTIYNAYKTACLEVPKLDDVLNASISDTRFSRNEARKFFQLFLDSGEIVKVSEEFYFLKSEITNLIKKLKQFAARKMIAA
ncbi:MAG: selenocysteine-specific translation elongation factor [Pyrinomonadaceae bacterium]